MAQMSLTCFISLLVLLAVFSRRLEGRWMITEEDDSNLEKSPKVLHDYSHQKLIQKKSMSYGKVSANSTSNPLLSSVEHRLKFPLEGPSVQALARNSSTSDIHAVKVLTHWAALKFENVKFYGSRATLNVYGLPEVGWNQASAAMISLVNDVGYPNNFNEIRAGWIVQPGVYGDHDTHFFVSWTVDANYTTGCSNLKCNGFVLAKSPHYVPGHKFDPVSVYDGEQYYITLKIFKDRQTGDWWLHAGRNADQPIGYWPNSLFTSLKDFASLSIWGGAVAHLDSEKCPPMGSGHLPREGDGKAASMTDVYSATEKLIFYRVTPNKSLQDKPDYYRIIEKKFAKRWLFGGPGGP